MNYQGKSIILWDSVLLLKTNSLQMKRNVTWLNRRVLTTVCCLGMMITGFSQTTHVERCGTDVMHAEKMKSDPTYRIGIEAAEMAAKKWANAPHHHEKDNSDEKVVIPIVFHVVYNKDSVATQKIAYERIVEQVEILNRDYNRQNRDTGNTRPIFDSIAASANIVFQLATVDPNGNPTNGVTYTETTVKGFDLLPFGAGYVALDSMKSTAAGGKSPWNTLNYLNIWVGRISYFTTEGLYGIATFPTNMPAAEAGGGAPTPNKFQGVCLLYHAIGSKVNAAGDTLYYGRTLTHEIGHYLGMRHIWGDGQNGASCASTASDFVDDTPRAWKNANFVCDFSLNECSDESPFWNGTNPPNNVENFMDYSGDLCYNMFTRGQVARQQSFINTSRAGTWGNTAAGGKGVDDFKAWAYTNASSCPNNCDGSIEIQALKGTAPYTYIVDGVAYATSVVTELCEGVHAVKVVDVNNDTIQFDAVIKKGNYEALVYTKSHSDATCATCTEGKAKVNISKGVAPFVVTWNTTPPVVQDSLMNVKPGVYHFTIKDACGDIKSDSVVVKNLAGIGDLDESTFVVYPNPTNEAISMSLTKDFYIRYISVSDITGRELMYIDVNQKINQQTINVQSLNSGVYQLNLVDENNMRKSMRFVKQ